MQIDLTTIMTKLDGMPLMQPPEQGQPDRAWTLRDVAVTVLMNELEKERSDGIQKLERYMLAQRIYGAESTIDLTAEQITLLKERIGRGFPAAIVGPAYAALESGA